MSKLNLVRLDGRHMQHFERLMAGKEFGGCYCAVWTGFGPDWDARCKERPKENLAATEARVRAGDVVGYLLERDDDGTYVGWIAAGPKAGFPYLKERPGSRLGPTGEGVWSIACLAIGFSHRGRGYSAEAIRLAALEAKACGATSLEAYPVDPCPEGGEYRGTRAMYEKAGFTAAEGEPSGEAHALRMELKLA
ncbi:GNAT family N-acetyltransferase [bacterium]|nr:MAG: GNAT family N-acetyltransferase [bacterium]